MVPATMPLRMGSLARSLTAVVLAAIGTVAAACDADDDARPLPGGSAGPVGSGGGGDGGGGDGGGGAGGDAATGVAPCSVWDGPYGAESGDVFDPLTRWDGFLPDVIEPTQVRMASLAACGGNDEVTAIVVHIDAVWCDVCRSVAADLAETYESSWRDRGVAVVSLVVEDADGNPADLEAAWQWRAAYGLEAMPVAIDPAYELANEQRDTLPQALIIDPVTMRIHARIVGDVDLTPYLDQVILSSTE